MYELHGFIDAYQRWCAREDPPTKWRLAAVDWAESAIAGPTIGARRAIDLPGFRWAKFVSDDRYAGTVTFEVVADTHRVNVSLISTLRLPL